MRQHRAEEQDAAILGFESQSFYFRLQFLALVREIFMRIARKNKFTLHLYPRHDVI
jgi:hypothetical protein